MSTYQFNQEKALVGAFSVITNLRMELFQALALYTLAYAGVLQRKNIMDGKPDFRQPHQLALFRLSR